MKTTAVMKRPAVTPKDQVQDLFLDRQRNRLRAAETIQAARKVADSGDLVKARAMITETMDIITASLSSQDELCKTFITDLKEALDGMVDRSEYYAKGQKKMMWKAQAHEQERAVGKGGYETKAKYNMKQKMEAQMKPQAPLPTIASTSNSVTLNKKLTVGNEHVELPESEAKDAITLPGAKMKHKWKMFVRGEGIDSVIEKVEFGLHPTFQPSRVVVASAPWEVERVGWGFFVVSVKVCYKPELKKEPSLFEHQLSFEGNGTSKDFDI